MTHLWGKNNQIQALPVLMISFNSEIKFENREAGCKGLLRSMSHLILRKPLRGAGKGRGATLSGGLLRASDRR